MNEPQTDFNPRYSSPDASEVPWSETQRALGTAGSYWISTVRPDGHPHVTPMAGVWRDGSMFFTTGPGRA